MVQRAVVLRGRVAERLPEDPVGFWLGRLDVHTRGPNRTNLERFMRWVRKQPDWADATARDLLVRHVESDDQYVVLDLLQGYVNSLVLRKNTKRKAYSAIRSYFAHNRCALPDDPSFRIRGDRPPIEAKLTVKDVQEACSAASVRYRSVILVKWQSFMDNERLIQANLHCAEQVVKQIQMGVSPVKIDLPGRKSNENDSEGRFYTFIGKDAVEALVKYFEEERGWPRKGQPLWLKPNGSPLTKSGFEAGWLRLFRHMGKISKRKGPMGSRYGYNLHEMRDNATTYLHTHAKAEGFDMDCVKFWCGQVGEIDPLKYDKFYKDTEYVRNQYLIAEKYLNIISNPFPTATSPEKEKEFRKLQEQVSHLTEGMKMMQDVINGKWRWIPPEQVPPSPRDTS
jgi:hypothetical protein